MSYNVLKSRIIQAGIDDFAATVANYASEVAHWREREQIIKNQVPLAPRPAWHEFSQHPDPATAYKAAIDKWDQERLLRVEPIPFPIAPPDVAASLNEGGQPDFEIINDDPTEDDILRAKKNELLQTVCNMELVAINKVLPPPGKRRSFELLEGDILKDEQDYVKSLVDADPNMKQDQIKAHINARRHPDHAKHLEYQKSCRNEVDRITRTAAEIMSQIEDLTIVNIDAYQIPSFN